MERQSSGLGHRVVLIGATAALAASIWAAPASGAVTFGSDLSESDFVNGACVMPTCTHYNGNLPAGRTLTSPISGVVVRWRQKQGNNSAELTTALRILRPVTLGPPITQVTALATGQAALLPTAAGTYEFSERLPIAAGDTIGINGADNHGVVATNDVTTEYLVEGPFPDNTTRMQDHGYAAQLMLNADVEPDADRDVFGDETQDNCIGTMGTVNGCPNTVTLGKATPSGKTVTVTATVPGAGTLTAGSADDTTLALTAKKKKKKKTTGPSLTKSSQTLTAKTSQTVALTLNLSKAGKSKLAKKGKLGVSIKVTYTPIGGIPGIATTSAKLKGKKKKKKKS